MLLGVIAFVTSCKDDGLELVPKWETAINGEGTITSAAKDFKRGDPSIQLDFDLKWISVDGKATTTKIDVFILFKEDYVDNDGNPAVANHGGDEGRLLASFEGSEVPANRTPVSFSLTQGDLYNLYSDVTYDYKDGVDGNQIAVFDNPINPGRDANNLFVAEDKFTVRWEFTASDGRVFGKYGNGWSPSVCSEFPGSNCAVNFGVICAEEIEEPAGSWTIDMVDTYGDGWQGGYISVIIDGAEADRAFLLSQYEPGGVPVSSGQKIIVVPGTATSLSFAWSPDDYDVECEFTITSPKGNVVASVSNPTEGAIKLNLCKE